MSWIFFLILHLQYALYISYTIVQKLVIWYMYILFYIFILGEDRWLSTLLLNKGFKLEYTAASDAYTYVPEGFFEFFNQRRRWSPSTLANILKIISNMFSVSKANANITKLYLIYHTFLFAASLITPGTIFLMILGATSLAFPEIPLWIAFVTNLLLISIVMLSCVCAEQKTQVNYCFACIQ